MRAVVWVIVVLGWGPLRAAGTGLGAGNASAGNMLVNDGFERGDGRPEGWGPVGPGTRWERQGPQGRLVVSGTGQQTAYWRQDVPTLRPGRVYRLSFRARATGSGGCAIAGTGSVNRDFRPGDQWQEYSYVFTVPKTPSGYVRLGQWHWNGVVWYDRVRLTEITVVHAKQDGVALGTGERLVNGQYVFEPVFGYEGSNVGRPLAEFTCGFNSNRWTFSPGSYLVYQHRIGGHAQKRASVSVNVGYHASGSCLVEVGRDGNTWQRIGRIDGVDRRTFEVPAALLPAETVYVRLRAGTGRDDAGRLEGGSFQVYDYTYRAELDGDGPMLSGRTHFVEIEAESKTLDVEVAAVGPDPDGSGPAVTLRVKNPTSKIVTVHGRAWIDTTEGGPENDMPGAGQTTTKPDVSARIAGGRTGVIRLPYHPPGAGVFSVRVALQNGLDLSYAARTTVSVTPLEDASFGYAGDANAAIPWWWCEGTYKVGRPRAMPDGSAQPVRMSACRGEYEPVQIVLRPGRKVTGLQARITGDNAALAAATQVYEVAYHYVRRPTDSAGCVGWWPDALPPLEEPIDLEAGWNQPLWVLTKVPGDCPAGDHRLWLTVTADGIAPIRIPITVHVYDFAMPYPGHVATAFGLSTGNIKRYHNLETTDELRQVWDAYMASFREHRISPYDFAPFDPIRLEWVRSGPEDRPELRAKLDFTAWDIQARRYLDGFGFNSFRLRLAGLGGGTFHSRRVGRIGPYEQGTAGYRAALADYAGQIQRHLEANGWLDEAYVYWFDEPEPKDYAFVVDGMNEIHRAAPKLRRMLTEEPNPALFGAVDIWCPVLHNHDPEACRARQEKGEAIWWYVCTGPKAPYPGLFIDHDAIDLRIWLWMTWKWNVQGILVWQSNYWTSSAAFPGGRLQNPWADPMGYVSGYGRPAGYIGYWGNGDGRFLYPPNRDIENDRRKYLAGPVSSIRWEMLREGLEDFEYFWMLREAIERARRAGNNTAAVDGAERLLTIPEAIIADKTHFTHDPQPLHAHRERIAEAIERLSAASSPDGGAASAARSATTNRSVESSHGPSAKARETSGDRMDERGFVSIFDGTTLAGWHAVPADSAGDWSVRDGVIVGRGSKDRLSYLVWRDTNLTDFELTLRYRLRTKGNTGIEIRAQVDPTGKRPFEGYHADLGHVGIGPQILGAWDFHFARRREPSCPRGTDLVIEADGRTRAVPIAGAVGPQDIRAGQWNDVRIIARGRRFQFFINGKPASAFEDRQDTGRFGRGMIGLQIHDRGMVVEFKDIRLKHSDTLTLETEPITRGPYHHFFGYIGQCLTSPWSGDGRYILSLRTRFHDRMPKPGEAADVVLIDTQDANRVVPIETTRAWNFQQGTMFYWHPKRPESQFFFNDRDPRTHRVFTVLYDIEQGRRVREYAFDDVPTANGGVSPTGEFFLAINYGRLARLRPVTGYPGAADPTADDPAPANDGIFRVDIATGRRTLLVSLRQLREFLKGRYEKARQAHFYINHTLCNRRGDRVYFFARGRIGDATMAVNVPCSVRTDGTGLKMHSYIGGHPEWAEGDLVIGSEGGRQVLYDVNRDRIVGQIGTPRTIPSPGGDIALSPDGEWLANGFATNHGSENTYVVVRRTDGLALRSEPFGRGPYRRGELRIDPAPRWNRRGNALLVPGMTPDGTRQLHVMRIVPAR